MKTHLAWIPRRSIAFAPFGLLIGLCGPCQPDAVAGIIPLGDVQFSPPNTLLVSAYAPGSVSVTGGSVLDGTAGLGAFTNIQIGASVTGDGTVTVDGALSKVVTSGSPSGPGLAVGGSGNGKLELTNGGSATVNRFDTNTNPGTTGTSSVKVDGIGSKITSASTFNIGTNGAGQLSPSATAAITNGGIVNAQTSVVGSLNGSNGKLTVDGAGSALNLVTGAVNAFGRAFLTIGREQRGEVDVLAGAKVKIDATPLANGSSVGVTLGGGGGTIADGGSFANGDGTLKIDGAGSELRIIKQTSSTNPFVAVGQQGKGQLDITNGGALVVEDATTGAMFVGRNIGAAGAVNVTGANSLLQAGRRLIIGADANPTTILPGGTGMVNVSNGATISATRTVVGSLGTLTGGGGTIVGELVNHGNITPGNSPGIMNVLGNVTLDVDGKVLLELGGNAAGLYDQLNARDDPATGVVEGNLSIGGVVSVVLYGGFDPFGGSFFDVFTAVGITENAPAYALPTLSSGLHWEHSIVGLADGGEALRLSVVPEPGSFALFGLGLIGLFTVSRRMRPAIRAR